MKQYLYFLTALLIITVLVWQVFSLISSPLLIKLNNKYLDYAQKDLVAGNFQDAQNVLNYKVNQKLVDQSRFKGLTDTAEKMSHDLFFEHDYMISHDNNEGANEVKQVTDNYNNVKELLQVSIDFWQRGKYYYANILLKRAQDMDPNYIGTKRVEDYFNSFNV